MKITLDKQDDANLLHLHEERVDAHNFQELKDYLLPILENGSKELILDLSEVRFIDSSGLGALLYGHKNAGLRKVRFVLAGVQARVQSMFELTRLERVFNILPSAEAALEDHTGETQHVTKPD
jgi:anti-sigma B factor antagonist